LAILHCLLHTVRFHSLHQIVRVMRLTSPAHATHCSIFDKGKEAGNIVVDESGPYAAIDSSIKVGSLHAG
jgi:hypothetical protein